MNAALKLELAQQAYDNSLPVEIDDSAERCWVDNGVYVLVELMSDVSFKRAGHQVQAVTFEQFAVAVDEFAMQQLGAKEASPSVLGRLILLARRKASSEACSAANEALNSPDPDEALREIARGLLRPLARDGLIAQREDDEL